AVSSQRVSVRIENRGTAPFYYPWKAELAAIDDEGRVPARWPTRWTVTGIQPGAAPAELSTAITTHSLRRGTYDIVLRIANPLPQGIPLRFANTGQDTHSGWLHLGTVTTR